jgi:hypothetical protein
MSDPDVSSMFSAQVQGIATLGASVVLGVITIYGYFRKLKVDLSQPATTSSYGDATNREVVTWLAKILDAVSATSHSIKAIEDLISARTRQDELDRAYQRGRDESLDRQTSQVAHALRDQPDRP